MKKIVYLVCVALMIVCVPALAAKVTIAIGDIQYSAKDSSENKRYSAYGNGSREDTRAFVDMVTTALVKTRKFEVIERNRMAEILKEQGLSMEGFVNGGYEGSDFNLKGVDYILTGAISEYGESNNATKMIGFSAGKRIATMAVDVRVLDVSTGSIGFAETIKSQSIGGRKISVKGFNSGGDSSSGALLGNVMRKTAIGVTNLIVSNIFPIKVVAVTSTGQVLLNYGSGLLAEGNVLEVFSQGESFVDPDTGEVLGNEEQLIGRINIVSAQDKFSKAVVIGDGAAIEKGMLARVVAVDIKKGKSKSKSKKLW